MQRLTVCFIICLAIFFNVSCQKKENVSNAESNIEFKRIYENLFVNKMYNELYELLQIWEDVEPYNPEMYIAYFNYYIFRDRFYDISLDYENKKNELSILKNNPDTAGNVSYLNESMLNLNNDIITALRYIDRGLNIAKYRLDMHFGKIYILNEIEYYNDAGNALYNSLLISKEIDNNWFWTNNERIDTLDAFYLDNISDYYSLWFKTEKDEAIAQIKKCAEKQLEMYPESEYLHSFWARYYLDHL